MSRTIAVEIVGDSASVERAFARSSGAAKSFDHSLGRSVRGAAAGTGVFRGLGRSIAFASATFLGFAAASDVLRGAITGAENLAKAQEGLAVAVRHTGGNADKLIPKYTALAKGAAQFGVNQSEATTELARATVLTGSAARAQRAYQEALVISKATGKDFNAVLIATSKGQEGVTTSLKRYGIQIATGTKGTEQFSIVMSRFAGQAKANTDAADRLRAVWANTETTIGTALLPTLDKYLTKLGDWLEKMQKSGRLQHDVNTVIHDGAAVFHVLEGVIRGVDKVTGSFKHTLEILLALKVASFFAKLAGAEGLLGIGGAATTATTKVTALRASLVGLGALAIAPIVIPLELKILNKERGFVSKHAGGVGKTLFDAVGAIAAGGATTGHLIDDLFGAAHDGAAQGAKAVLTPGLKNLGRGGSLGPSFLPRFPGTTRGSRGGRGDPTAGPFGNAQPLAPFKSFTLTLPEQLTQARAALTKSTADDVAAAKQVIARIKRLMDEGKLSGKSLLQALQAESAAMSTLQSAQAAAAQKAAAAAQKAAAQAQARFQNLLDPLKFEVQLSRAEAFGKSTIPALRALLASTKRVLASAKSLAEEKAALDQITQLNQALKSAQTTAVSSFTVPAKLQLALAKDAALGKSSTKDLLKLKAAILKFIRTHKNNIAALTDAYNQLAAVNQQLGSSASSALGLFKQASTKALTAGLDLTPAQRKALRARLSQLGPGGTVPGMGVGAGGYVIDPTTGKPIKGNQRASRTARVPSQQTMDKVLRLLASGRAFKDEITVVVNLDGKKVATSTTRHQHRKRGRNPTQRRGPNAATSTA